MSKVQQAVLRGNEIVAVVTASAHGAIAAGARKAGCSTHGLRVMPMMEYVAAKMKAEKEAETELVWEVDETDPDCSKKDAALFR